MTSETSPGRRATRCPNCGAPTEFAFRPFCSRRCADVDLSRWLRGAYVIAGRKDDADEDGDDRPGAREEAAAREPSKDRDKG